MKKEILLCLLILTSVVSITAPTASASTDSVNLLWSLELDVYDIAVSKDGQYMAVTGWHEGTGYLLFFNTTDPPALWSCSDVALSTNETLNFDGVAISADGSEVVVGVEYGFYDGVSTTWNNFLMYFNESWTRVGDQTTNETWSSVDFDGPIERNCLDMSDDGVYIVAGGTGVNVFYFNESTTKFGSDTEPAWWDYAYGEIYSVDISSNGQYVGVASTSCCPEDGELLYYKDAFNFDPYAPNAGDLMWTFEIFDNPAIDVAVSDDGYSVSLVGDEYTAYWANASNRFNEPEIGEEGIEPTWVVIADEYSEEAFYNVDMSSDGNEVFVGGPPEEGLTVYFMAGARTTSGELYTEDFTWKELGDHYIFDVALSDDGSIGVATAAFDYSYEFYAYFFKSNGEIIDSYPIGTEGDWPSALSMSGDGGIVAIGTEYDSNLYVFQVKTISPVQYFSVTLDPSYTSYLVGEIYPLDEPRKVSVYVEVEPNGTEPGDQFVVFATLLQNGTWKVLGNNYYIINHTEGYAGDSMPMVLLIWDQLPVAEGMQLWVVRTGTDNSNDNETLTFQVIIHDFGEDKLDLILQMLNDPNTGLVEIKEEIKELLQDVQYLEWDIDYLHTFLSNVNNTIVNRLYWMSDNYTVSLTNITTMLETIYDKLGIPVVGGLLMPLAIPFYIMAMAPYLAAVLAGILALLFLARRMGRTRG